MENRYSISDYLHNSAVVLQKTNDTADVPPHSHEFLELIYLWKGSASHAAENNITRLSEGDYLLIDSGTVHHFFQKSDDFCILQCLFIPEFADASLKNCHSISDVLKSSEIGLYCAEYAGTVFHDRDENVRRELAFMLTEFEEQRVGYTRMIRCCLLKILLYSVRDIDSERICAHPIIQRILCYTKEHPERNDNLTVLSEKLHYSPSRLSTLFKIGTGKTYSQYLRCVRMHESAKMLAETDDSIETIAELVGYSDVRAYRKYFKDEMGITPLRYRIRARKP